MKSLPSRYFHGVLLRQFVNLCLRGMQNISFFLRCGNWLWRFAATLLELRACPAARLSHSKHASTCHRIQSQPRQQRQVQEPPPQVGRPMPTNNDPISLPVTNSQRKTSYLSMHAASAQRLIFLPSSTASLHFFSLYPCLPT